MAWKSAWSDSLLTKLAKGRLESRYELCLKLGIYLIPGKFISYIATYILIEKDRVLNLI
mgnify:CR=1 FL=1